LPARSGRETDHAASKEVSVNDPEGSGRGHIAGDVAREVRSVLSAADDAAVTLEREARERAERRLADAEAEASALLEAARVEARALLDGAKESLREALSAVDRASERPTGDVGHASIREGSDRPADPLPPAIHGGERAASPFRSLRPLSTIDGELAGAELGEPTRSGGATGQDDHAQPSQGERVAQFGGARQVAVQMAAAGSTRSEVASHLQRTFELQDPSEILNGIFVAAGLRR